MPFDVCPEETSYSMNHLVSAELDALCSVKVINRFDTTISRTFLKYKRKRKPKPTEMIEFTETWLKKQKKAY